MLKKTTAILTSILGLFIFTAFPAFAHVVVKPDQVGIAAFQTFSMDVPNEKDNPVVALRLVIPDGLKYVSPNVKPGWKIEIKKDGEGDKAKVTEISWTEGLIPAGQRDDFLLSAQVPPNETTLSWKAYQTYSDGSTIAWDHAPSKDPQNDSAPPPYSQTKIVNDLVAKPKMNEDQNGLLITLSGLALLFSVISLSLQLRNR